MKKFYLTWVLALPLFLLNACTSIPEGIKPIDNFQLEHYLGQWYEIARLDHSFERGLEQVTATYSLNQDGSVRVLNRGFNAIKQQWQEAEGRAQFVESPQVSRLKVSFFGPFYGGYNIVELDKNYQYALIIGNNRSYLWILSRTPRLDPTTQEQLIQRAQALGFATEQLILVKQP
ncbi:lipocalin family protein [uncultured Thiothrix sp.]|uniref:lipocalin family protein n=1 Tax=uncultured Thiothrix sp. TaxID=223185 RepID=UPI002631E0AF|nr:lipocalin family protein [uncultured Thiothrix sp.]HMT92705.1 lipocalin family protein [Thiolinea sp.]